MPKDRWDKADIIGKFFSGVVLAVIALMIKTGTDDISAAQGRGDLVRQLIADLTTKDQRTRQDLALIALNRSVGEQTPQLVVEVAERLVLDTMGYSTDRAAAQALGSVAFRILQERDPARADEVRQQLEQQFEQIVSSDSLGRAALRSDPDTSRHPAATAGDSTRRAITDVLARVSSSVVYIQFQGGVQRSVVEELRRRLSGSGFVAPGVERITKPFSSAVRYFHPGDSVLADSAARITRAFLEERGLGVGEFRAQNLAALGSRVPRGQVEVWVSVR
jgi:hypothetical protein